MKLLSLIAIALAGALTEVNAQGPVIEAEACSVELTTAGQGSWRGTFIYRGTVANDGRISSLEMLPISSSSTMRNFVRLDQLETCVRRWQFAAPGSLTLTFEAGTIGDVLQRWRITVSQSTLRFRLRLPRTGPEPAAVR